MHTPNSCYSASFSTHHTPHHALHSLWIPDLYHFCTASTLYPASSAALSCVLACLPHMSTASRSFHVKLAISRASSTTIDAGHRRNLTTTSSFITSLLFLCVRRFALHAGPFADVTYHVPSARPTPGVPHSSGLLGRSFTRHSQRRPRRCSCRRPLQRYSHPR